MRRNAILCILLSFSFALFSLSAVIGCKVHNHIFDVETQSEETLKSRATCVERAKYYYTCSCGQISGETFFEAGDFGEHEYSEEFSLDRELTEAETGIISRHCINCDARTDITQINHGDSKYIVKYVNYDGSILKLVLVDEGQNAVAPEAPLRNGYVFTGWSGDAVKVFDHLEIVALYEKRNYCNVSFVDYNGVILSEQTVLYGEAAIEPNHNEYEGYGFNGWDVEFDCVRRDLTITALYSINLYSVKFYNYDGNLLEEKKVPFGESAEEPDIPQYYIAPESFGQFATVYCSYRFKRWRGNFTRIKNDMEIYPEYERFTEKPVLALAITERTAESISAEIVLVNVKSYSGLSFFIEYDSGNKGSDDTQKRIDIERYSSDLIGYDLSDTTYVNVIGEVNGEVVQKYTDVLSFSWSNEGYADVNMILKVDFSIGQAFNISPSQIAIGVDSVSLIEKDGYSYVNIGSDDIIVINQ